MGEFIAEMQALFESRPMRRESVDALLRHQVYEVEFCRGEDARMKASMVRMSRIPSKWYRGRVDIWLNICLPSDDVEVCFAHEIAHAYYDGGLHRLFRKHEEGFSEPLYEAFVEGAARMFVADNPGYLTGVLADLLAGKGGYLIDVMLTATYMRRKEKEIKPENYFHTTFL